MKREEWERKRNAWAHSMQRVADSVGKGSKLYEAMGSLAWGRYEGEPSATANKDSAVFGFGYIKGKRDALLEVARMEQWPGYEALRRIHDTVREYER